MNTEESTHSSHRPVPFVVPPIIDRELEWFFDRAESNCRDGWAWEPDPIWCTVAYRTIHGWLSAMDDYDAGILAVAYSRGPRPLRLLRRLGRLTTVVVRLASVEAGWPEDPGEQRGLERCIATFFEEERVEHRPRSVTRYVQPAVELLRTAVRAYARERGPGPAVISTRCLRRGGRVR